MVAKMNFRQISFLHVYHHSSIFVVWWLTVFMAPSSEAYFSSMLNSFIHVVMYSYYLFSSLGVARSITRAIKPYITMGQMTQFTMMMVQATYDIVVYMYKTDEEKAKAYPQSLFILLWFYMWTMLGLFANFFMQNYKKPAALKQQKTEKEE